ncbi:MAG: hypothetical protein KIT07_04965 [Anaerolineales bacterium]|nr:hypothetical protein [Anaerolineales bacterium]
MKAILARWDSGEHLLADAVFVWLAADDLTEFIHALVARAGNGGYGGVGHPPDPGPVWAGGGGGGAGWAEFDEVGEDGCGVGWRVVRQNSPLFEEPAVSN